MENNKQDIENQKQISKQALGNESRDGQESDNKPCIPNFLYLVVFLIIILIFSPILSPIVFPQRTFLFGDLTTNSGPNSAQLTAERTLYLFESYSSTASFEYMRYSPLFSLIALIGSAFALSESWIWAVMTLMAISIGYGGLVFLFKRYFPKSDWKQFILFIAITLFYFLNFYSVTRIIHLFIWLGYLVFPMLLYLGLSVKDKFRLWKICVYTLIFVTFAVIPHGFIYAFILHIGITVFLLFNVKFRDTLIFLIFPLGVFALVFSCFFEGSVLAAIGYPVGLNINQLEFLSKNGGIFNTLALVNNWWVQVPQNEVYNNTAFMGTGLLISVFMVVFWFVLVVKEVFRKNLKRVLLLISGGLATLFIVVLAGGMKVDLVSQFANFLADKDMLSLLSPFREWGRIALMLPIVYVGLVLIVISRARKNWQNIALISIVPLFFINILISPVNIPYLTQYYNPVEFPEEYSELRSEIKSDAKVVWERPINRNQIDGLDRYLWNVDKTANITGNKYENSVGIYYRDKFKGRPLFIRYLESGAKSVSLLEQMNYGGVVLRKDICTDGEEQFAGAWRDKADLNFKDTEYFDYAQLDNIGSIYQVDNPVGLSVLSQDVSLWDSLSEVGIDFVGIDSNEDIDNLEQSYAKYLILDGFNSDSDIEKREIDFTNLLAYDWIAGNNDELVFETLPYSSYHEPGTYWSRGSVLDTGYEPFNSYLGHFSLSNYQTDYDRGLVFTYADPRADSDAHKDIAPIEGFNFGSDYDFERFSDVNQQVQFEAVQSIEQVVTEDRDFIEFTLKDSTPGWKTISTPLIAAPQGDFLRFNFQVRCERVFEPHIKVATYDEDEKYISTEYIKNLDCSDEWSEVSIDFYQFRPQVEYIKFQVWHGDNTDIPLPNRISLSNFYVYSLMDITDSASIDIDTDVESAGKYRVITRVMESPSSWGLAFGVNGQRAVLNTNAKQTRFIWRDLGSFDLEKNSKITISNLSGINAVNLLLVIPEQDFKEVVQKAEGKMRNMYDDYIYTLDLYGDSTQEFSVLKSGEYAAKLVGGKPELDEGVVVNEREYSLGEDIFLSEGEHEIGYSLDEDDGEYRQVLLIPVALEASQTRLKDLDAVRVDPNTFEGKLVSSGESMIILNELYDKNWVLYLNDGSEQKEVSPREIFSAVNGYQIPEGNYEFKLVYKSAEIILILKLVGGFIYMLVGLGAILAGIYRK